VLADNLALLELGPIIEALSVILCTILLCFICFEIIRRTNILKPLFGVRMKKNHSKTLKI
jgi:hypothetical protein